MYNKHTMIDYRANTNCFDSIRVYAVSKGIVRQRWRCWIELSVQSQSESEHATSIDELSVRYTLVRLMNTLAQFCGDHAGSISCLEHWICSSSNSFAQYSNRMRSFVKARWLSQVSVLMNTLLLLIDELAGCTASWLVKNDNLARLFIGSKSSVLAIGLNRGLHSYTLHLHFQRSSRMFLQTAFFARHYSLPLGWLVGN